MKIGLVSLPLYIIYYILKVITRVAMRVYFRDVEVINPKAARHPHGYILVSNHPNTLVDVLNTAKLSNKVVHFLANAGLFKSKIGNWIFSTFYCIKVERREDVHNGRVDNNHAFERSHRFLKDGGCIYIAPEGTSWNNRILHNLKTGVARIIFQASEKYALQDKICVIPVGLDYTKFGFFRAGLLIQVGEPIYVDGAMTSYQETPKKAIKRYILSIREQLESLSLNCQDKSTEKLLATAEGILQNDYPLSLKENFERNKHVLKKILPAEAHSGLRKDLETYQKILDTHGLDDVGFSQQQSTTKFLGRLLRALLMFPLFTLGAVLTGPVLYAIHHITKKYSPHPEYNTTGHILLYLMFFPIYLLFIILVLKGLFGLAMLPIMVLIFSFIPLTVVFREIFLEYGKVFALYRVRVYCHKYKEKSNKTKYLRQQIVENIGIA